MPFQNLTTYRQQKEDSRLNFAISVSEEHLDLEGKINNVAKYQKPYTKKILIGMARANPSAS